MLKAKAEINLVEYSFYCPNCGVEQYTYETQNNPEEYYCEDCGEQIEVYFGDKL